MKRVICIKNYSDDRDGDPYYYDISTPEQTTIVMKGLLRWYIAKYAANREREYPKTLEYWIKSYKKFIDYRSASESNIVEAAEKRYQREKKHWDEETKELDKYQECLEDEDWEGAVKLCRWGYEDLTSEVIKISEEWVSPSSWRDDEDE
jgi:hypothetical protein